MTQVKYNLQDTGKVGRLLWFWPGRGWQSCWTQPGKILVKKLLFRQLLYNCEIWWRCWDVKIVKLGKFKNSLLGQHCYNGHLFCWENMWAEINGSFQQWGWVRRKLKRKCLQLIAHNPFFFYSFKSKKWKSYLNICPRPAPTIDNKRKPRALFSSRNHRNEIPEWNFVYFISFILRLEWQDEVGMTKNSHSRVILKGMMIERYLTSHPSSRSFEVILTWNDLRMTKYPHSVVIPGWLGMNFRLHEKSPDFWAGPWRVQGMMWNDAGMM